MDATPFTSTSEDWLKAEELQSRHVTLTIKSVEVVEFGEGQDSKLGLKFNGREKGIIANKTNTKALVNDLGKETEGWVGKQIMASPNMTPLGLGFALTAVKGDFDDDIPF